MHVYVLWYVCVDGCQVVTKARCTYSYIYPIIEKERDTTCVLNGGPDLTLPYLTLKRAETRARGKGFMLCDYYLCVRDTDSGFLE